MPGAAATTAAAPRAQEGQSTAKAEAEGSRLSGAPERRFPGSFSPSWDPGRSPGLASRTQRLEHRRLLQRRRDCGLWQARRGRHPVSAAADKAGATKRGPEGGPVGPGPDAARLGSKNRGDSISKGER